MRRGYFQYVNIATCLSARPVSDNKVYRHEYKNKTLTIRVIFEEVHKGQVDASNINVECESDIYVPGERGSNPHQSKILIDSATPLDALKGLSIYGLTFKYAEAEAKALQPPPDHTFLTKK